MKEKYNQEDFIKKTNKSEDRIFLALIAVVNELAELNMLIRELKEKEK